MEDEDADVSDEELEAAIMAQLQAEEAAEMEMEQRHQQLIQDEASDAYEQPMHHKMLDDSNDASQLMEKPIQQVMQNDANDAWHQQQQQPVQQANDAWQPSHQQVIQLLQQPYGQPMHDKLSNVTQPSSHQQQPAEYQEQEDATVWTNIQQVPVHAQKLSDAMVQPYSHEFQVCMLLPY